MKTTIDIPEPLYRKVKIRAAETGTTLKQIVLTSLTKELRLATQPRRTGNRSWRGASCDPAMRQL